jgi:hypothetical protein
MLVSNGTEATLDFGNPELALPVKDTIGLLDEVNPVCAHKSKTEDSDVDGTVSERQVGDISLGDQRAWALKIVALDVNAQFLAICLKSLSKTSVTTAKICNGTLLLRARQWGLGERCGRGSRLAFALLAGFAASPDIFEEAVDRVLRPNLDLASETLVILIEHLWRFIKKAVGLFGGAGVESLIEMTETC